MTSLRDEDIHTRHTATALGADPDAADPDTDGTDGGGGADGTDGGGDADGTDS